jgi:hypothetical protein
MFSLTLAIVFCFGLLACILYVLFGQITVRKLRKNPDTKHELGLSFVSGWDILNVAQALAWPGLNRKIKQGQLGALEADPDMLRKHTNKFDRFLGAAFYWTFMGSGLSLVTLSILNLTGLFV